MERKLDMKQDDILNIFIESKKGCTLHKKIQYCLRRIFMSNFEFLNHSYGS